MANRKYLQERVPLYKVIVLPQVRITFDPAETRELADNIALKGIIQPSILAKLTEEEMQQHIDFVNKLKGCSLKLRGMPKVRKNGQTYYYYLIAGERRYRAHKLLHQVGCTACRKSGKAKSCYKKHTGSKDLMEARVCVGINPLDAKSLQFQENTHRRPPEHEEIYAFAEMFASLRLDDPKYTLTSFAGFVGVGVEKVRRALNFTELPDHIRVLTEDGLISVSHALELKRLLELGGNSDVLVHRQIEYLMLARKKPTVTEFRDRITQIIDGLDQTSMFEEQALLNKNERRGVVAQNMILGLVHAKAYLDRVALLIRKGYVGKGKPLSGKSPERWIALILKSTAETVQGFRLTKSQRLALGRINLERPQEPHT